MGKSHAWEGETTQLSVHEKYRKGNSCFVNLLSDETKMENKQQQQ